MSDMVLCYGSADGAVLRAQALYREKFSHSQTFLDVVQRLRDVTFRPRSVDRCQERKPRASDLQPQIIETMEENPSTSIRKLFVNFRFLSLWYVALLRPDSSHGRK
jgi:L-lactate utilization protein LutC